MYSQTYEEWKKSNTNYQYQHKKRGAITKESYDVERIIKQCYK